MTGVRQAEDSASARSYKVLRNKLNELSYYQPLSEESLALADRLLNELLRSKDNLHTLQQRLEEGRQDSTECLRELEALRREHPRLLRENTALHSRLLSDSVEREQRNARWIERTDTAKQRLAHVQTLQQQESLRATTLHQTMQLMKNHIVELKRLGAGAGAAAAGVCPRRPSITFKGDVPGSSRGLPGRRGVESSGADARLALRVHEVSAKLSAARQQRASLVAKLKAANLNADAARAEVGRLSSYDGTEHVESLVASEAPGLQFEESQLASQDSFLSRSCASLRTRCQSFLDELKKASDMTKMQTREARQLEYEIAAMREASLAQERDEDAGHEQQHALQVRSALHYRKAGTDYAMSMQEHEELRKQLEAARSRADATVAENVERLESLRQRLADEQLRRPVEQLESLKAELKEDTSRQAWHKIRCADLSARLAAVQTHESVQERTLRARAEEGSAALRARDAGEREARGLGAQLDNLEMSVLGARSETQTLQTCIEEVAAQQLTMSDEFKVTKEEAESLEAEASARQATQSRLAAEVEQARSSVLNTEELATESRHEETRLRSESERLRQRLLHSESDLASVQANHRELSSGVDSLVAELLQGRAEQRTAVGEESELEVLIRDSGEEIQRARAEHERTEQCVLRDEEQRLRAALLSARGTNERLSCNEEEVKSNLMQRIGHLEPNMERMRSELAQLSRDRPAILQKLKAKVSSDGSKTMQSEQVQVAELSRVLQVGEEQHAANLERLSVIVAHRETLEPLAKQLSSTLVQRRAALGEAEVRQVALEASAARDAQEKSVAEASLSVVTRQVEEMRAVENTATDGLQELEGRQRQLVALLRGLEDTREQLSGQLRDANTSWEDERRFREQALAGPASAKERAQEVAAEGQHLRLALESVEADRTDLMHVAATRLGSLEQLSEQASQVRAAQADMQWTLDRLRHASDVRQSELATQANEIEVAARQIKALEAEASAAESEAQERQRDALLGVDDLQHMTKENQLLHDELLQMRRQNDALCAGAEEQKAFRLPHAQMLQGAELEREHVLRIYRQAVESHARDESAVAQLAVQEERTCSEVESLREKLSQVHLNAEEAKAFMLDENRGLMTLRSQLSQITRSLEMHELTREEASAERARMQHAVGLRQAAISAAYQGDAASVAEVEALQREVTSLQEELQEVQVVAGDNYRGAEEASRQQKHLQELLLHHRVAQQQAEVENVALRRRIAESGLSAASLAAAGSAGSRGIMSAASTQDQSSLRSETSLQSTLQQQSALLALMRKEHQELAEKAQELRKALGEASTAGAGSAEASSAIEPRSARASQQRPKGS